MADKAALLAEAYRRNLLPADKRAAYEEGVRRGIVKDPYAKARATADRTERSRNIGLLGGITAQVTRNLGVDDELSGAVNFLAQGGENLVRRATGQRIDVPAATAYQAGADASRAEQQRFRQAHPNQNVLASGAAFGVAGVPRAGAAALANPLAAGTAAAVSNLPFAVARQEGNALERAPGAALETAAAFGLGAGGQAIGARLAAAGSRAKANPTPARRLSQQGVDLTPGQMVGGLAQRIEDTITVAPMTGAAVRGARTRGIESFDKVAINDALKPTGRTVSAAGRDGLAQANAAIEDAYNKALAGLRVPVQSTFDTAAAQAVSRQGMTPALRQEAQSVIDGFVTPRLGAGRQIDGETWKLVDADLRAAIDAAQTASASQPSQRILRDALKDVRAAWAKELRRVRPAAYGAVRRADAANARLSVIRKAAQYTGTAGREGLFTAPDLNRAVQAADNTVGNRAYGEGSAMMQGLSEDAMRVLPQTVPTSGTAERLAVGGGLYGFVGGGVSPEAALAVGAVDAAGAAIYSRPVQAILNAAYRAKNPGQVRALAGQLLTLGGQNPELKGEIDQALKQLGVAPQRQSVFVESIGGR